MRQTLEKVVAKESADGFTLVRTRKTPRKSQTAQASSGGHDDAEGSVDEEEGGNNYKQKGPRKSAPVLIKVPNGQYVWQLAGNWRKLSETGLHAPYVKRCSWL